MGCGASAKAGGESSNSNACAPIATSAVDEKKENKQVNASFSQTFRSLADVPMMQRLGRDQHPCLAAAMETAKFETDQVVVKQGDPSTEFFLIHSGQAKMEVEAAEGVASQATILKAGDYFGEFALLRDEPWATTVVAESTLVTSKISRSKFESLGLGGRLHFAAPEPVGTTEPPADNTDLKEEELSFIAEAVRGNKKMQAAVTLDDARIKLLCCAARKQEVGQGKDLVAEGGPGANFFYVVQEGSFEVAVRSSEDSRMSARSSVEAAQPASGSVFAEVAVAEQPASGNQEPVASQDAAGSQEMASFIEALTFEGSKPGYKFEEGPDGVGYYLKDAQAAKEAAAQAAGNGEVQETAPSAEQPAEGAAGDQDAPANQETAPSPAPSTEEPSEGAAGDQEAAANRGAASAERASADEGQRELVSVVTKGGSFGEHDVLCRVPRTWAAMAKEDSIAWAIGPAEFRKVLTDVSGEKIQEYVGHLDRTSLRRSLLPEEKTAMARALVDMRFVKGEVMLKRGEVGNVAYILYDGEAVVTEEKQPLTASADGQAHFFGDFAPLQTTTVTVASETAKALALDRDSFSTLPGPLQGWIKESLRKRVRRKDLAKVGLIGCGGFGAVELFEHRPTGETYALKGLSKGYIVKTGMQESVMNEKNIQMMLSSPFLVKLYECYNGAQTMYLLMEPALGGELYATYNRKGLHGSEKHAKYYVASAALALDYLHVRYVIHRNIKPEDLILSGTGQLKLCDFGLSKMVVGKTYTTCGTPDYFAPELIASSGHNRGVDWWALGVLLFELLAGHPPFESAFPMQIYSKVMKGIGNVTCPPKCQGPVGDLIKAILMKEPNQRLPMLPGGLKNLQNHKYYNGFDWAALGNGNMEAPYKPIVKSKKDISNFSARKEDMPRQIQYVDDGTGWDKDFATSQ